MKKIITTLLLALLITTTQAQQANKSNTTATKPTTPAPQAIAAQVNPAVPGVGVVVKKNPGGGANMVLAPTDANGESTLTISKKGNYTFTITAPSAISNMAANQGGPVKGVKVGLGKNPPNGPVAMALPNEKGEVVFKNLPVGNYWVTVVTNDNTQESIPASMAVYCLTGKWDKKGNCITPGTGTDPNTGNVKTAEVNAAKAAINCDKGYHLENMVCVPDMPYPTKNITEQNGGNYGILSAEVGYLISTNNTNTKDNKPLFAGNGQSAGICYRWGRKYGIYSTLAYQGGKTDETSMYAFAETLVESPFTYKITGWQKTWSRFNFAVGPSIFIDNKNKIELTAVGGIGFGKESSLTIDEYDAQTKVGTVYNVTQKSVIAFWDIGVRYRVYKRISVKGSFGSNGATAGVQVQLSNHDYVGHVTLLR